MINTGGEQKPSTENMRVPIANSINSAAPLVVSLALIVGAVFTPFIHARAGVARDAEQVGFYLDLRNRSG